MATTVCSGRHCPAARPSPWCTPQSSGRFASIGLFACACMLSTACAHPCTHARTALCDGGAWPRVVRARGAGRKATRGVRLEQASWVHQGKPLSRLPRVWLCSNTQAVLQPQAYIGSIALLNHVCGQANSNVALTWAKDGSITAKTLTRVRKGDEIRYDYNKASSWMRFLWHACQCRSKDCRAPPRRKASRK